MDPSASAAAEKSDTGACSHASGRYRGHMSTRAKHRAPLWALLCALVLGLLGMHHLSLDGAEHTHTSTAEATASSMAMPPQGQLTAVTRATAASEHETNSHNVLHLCLAILCAVTALIGIALLHKGSRGLLLPSSCRAPTRASWHRPARPPAGPDLLSSICVFRL